MTINLTESIERDAILSNIAYRSKMIYKKNGEILTEIKGMKKLFCTEDLELKDPVRGYNNKADIWIDLDNKIIVSASSGTRILANLVKGTFFNKLQSFTNDFFDNLDFFKGDLPKKTEAIRATNAKILEILEELAKQDIKYKIDDTWTFEYTGHCIGGSFASIGAADMYLKTQDLSLNKSPLIRSIVFEPLGINDVIKNFYKTYSPDGQVKSENSGVENIIILNRENIANLASPQLESAKIYELNFSNYTEPTNEANIKWVSSTFAPIIQSSESYFGKALKIVLGKKNGEAIIKLVSPIIETIKTFFVSSAKINQDIINPEENSNINSSTKSQEIDKSEPTILGKKIVGLIDYLFTKAGVSFIKSFASPSEIAFRKVEKEGAIHTTVRQMTEEHSLKFLRNIEEHNEIRVNGIKTKLNNLLEKKTHISFNQELFDRYELETKFNGLPLENDCDVLMDLGQGNLISMSSQIIRKINKGCDLESILNKETIPFNAELLARYKHESAHRKLSENEDYETIKMEAEYGGLTGLFFGEGSTSLNKKILLKIQEGYKDEIPDIANPISANGEDCKFNDSFCDFV
jgi:hypothetical protein